ncbi:MAG: GNAT family N-acetyltransferase, partial [Chloroflexi bacterium]|nr:GNAT family N-acetyltransferase [Chloroflexota bacterium]
DDAGAIGNFLSRSTRGRIVVPYEKVVERLGSKAYFLATQDQIVALAGWRAENLVGRIDDLVVYPGSARPAAGRALFEQIEKEARQLECEVLLLYVPVTAAESAVVFYQSLGFARRLMDDIPVPWRQAAEEFSGTSHFVMAKQLRELITKPI